MTINNFDAIKNLLDFTVPNTMYFLQILKRRKENPDLKTNVKVVNNYYLYTDTDLDKYKEYIIEDCEKHNARAYMNVNRLDTYRIALHTQSKITELLLNNDFKAVRNAYASACGNHHAEHNKRWVLDIDVTDMNFVNEVVAYITELQSEIKGGYKVLGVLPTKNGYHIISNPFNKKKFVDRYSDELVGIKDSSPTLLYM